MSSGLDNFLARFGSIALGIAIGTSAKYGLTMSEGRPITARMLVTDLLMIALVAVLAAQAVEQMGMHGNGAVLVAALFAVSSDRIIRMARMNFERLQGVDVDLQDVVTPVNDARQAAQITTSGARVARGTRNPSVANEKFSGRRAPDGQFPKKDT